MTLTKQFGALLRMNLASIPSRLGLVCTIIVGVTCAVGVLVSMLAMGVGARREALGNVRADRATIYSVDAPQPNQSVIPKEAAAAIRELPGIKRNAKGDPITVGQVGVFVLAREKTHSRQVGFPVIGVTPGITDYRTEMRFTAGRMFRPGLRELIASNNCADQFADFRVGDKRLMRGGEWQIVGNFVLGTTQGVCTVYGDADTVLSAFGRNTLQQVSVMLESPAALERLNAALKSNPTLRVQGKFEAQIIEEGMQRVNGILNFVSYFVGGIMALAATIGSANSLYAIVDGRRRELATLRAIGFDGVPIVGAMMLEAVVLALPGALIGAVVAWTLFNGYSASPMGNSLRLAVTPELAMVGLIWALVMGLISGFLPALRAARVPVTTGLRAL